MSMSMSMYLCSTPCVCLWQGHLTVVGGWGTEPSISYPASLLLVLVSYRNWSFPGLFTPLCKMELTGMQGHTQLLWNLETQTLVGSFPPPPGTQAQAGSHVTEPAQALSSRVLLVPTQYIVRCLAHGDELESIFKEHSVRREES